MKKFLVLILCLFTFNVTAQQVITITVPSNKVAKAAQGYLSLYPNAETIDDPNYIGTGEIPQIAKYTNKAWIREKVRRNFVKDVRRGLEKLRISANKTVIDNGVAK